jgi:hypothetical protein
MGNSAKPNCLGVLPKLQGTARGYSRAALFQGNGTGAGTGAWHRMGDGTGAWHRIEKKADRNEHEKKLSFLCSLLLAEKSRFYNR